LDDVWFFRSKDRAKSLQTAEQLTHKGIDLSGQDAHTHRSLSAVFLLRRQYEKAVMEIEKAIELEPNSASCLFTYGMILRLVGRFDEAIPVLEKAIRLNPITPINYLNVLAWAYAGSEQYEKAVSLWNKTIERNPDYLFAYMGLTGAYQFLGDERKAREAAAEVLRIKPNFSVVRVEKTSPTKDPAEKNRWADAFRKSGLPD
jgi:adenylate cyclase